MKLHVIGTGSKGNSYFLEENGSGVLLDAGVRSKQILDTIHYDIRSIKVAVITHVHGDHSLSQDWLEKNRVPVNTGQDAYYGEWAIKTFDAYHDVPCKGFIVSNMQTGHKVLYATDTYQLPYLFPGITQYVIECNYCTNKLMENIAAGKVFQGMKKRLLISHMSLDTLDKFFQDQDMSGCVKIVLVHLSDGNSDETEMVERIYSRTGVDTVAAHNGDVIDFTLFEF